MPIQATQMRYLHTTLSHLKMQTTSYKLLSGLRTLLVPALLPPTPLPTSSSKRYRGRVLSTRWPGTLVLSSFTYTATQAEQLLSSLFQLLSSIARTQPDHQYPQLRSASRMALKRMDRDACLLNNMNFPGESCRSPHPCHDDTPGVASRFSYLRSVADVVP